MKIAIVTVVYNNQKDTSEWLESSKNLDLGGLATLRVVVDNGSDKSIGKLVVDYPNTVWIQTGKNLGFTGGFNRGIRYAKEWGADYVLIINNDTLFSERNLVKKMIESLQDHPLAGIVSPKIYFAPKYEFYKSRYSKKDEGRVIWYAGGRFDWDNVRSIHRGLDEIDKGIYDGSEETDFASGCCVMIRRDVLEKVGYFEEKLFAYYEDADWMERIKKAGYKLWYNGQTSIYHKVSRTAGIGSAWSDYLITRNRLWFGMKWANNKTRLALLREAARLFFGGRKPQKEGVWDFITNTWGWKKASTGVKVEYPVELSIIIINYKTTKLLLQLLESIYRQRYRNFEIIVLDNSPDEPCKKEVLAKYPNLKFIANKVNNGFSAGNNQMIDYSLGKYILLLNSDIEVKENTLINLMKEVDKFGERAIYGGNLFFPTGEEQDSCFRLPNAWGAFKEYFLGVKGSYFMYRPKKLQGYVQVEGAVMAAFLIPRRVINEIGRLQEETFMYFEDIEYCRRAKKAEIPIYFVFSAEFIHYHGQASKKAGNDLSYQRNVQAAKWYHGKLKFALVSTVLWAGQKWGKVITPVSRWKEDK